MSNIAVLKEQLRRFWPIIPLTLVGYAVFILIPIFLQDNVLRENSVVQLIYMGNTAMRVSTLLVPFAIVMFLFHPLFDSRTATAFHHFSDNKNVVFWMNIIAGVALMLAPLVAVGLFTLIINDPSASGMFFLRMTVSYLFYFSVFIMAAMLAGNAFMAIILCLLLPILPYVIYSVGILAARLYLPSLDISSAPESAIIMGNTNPVMWYENLERINQGVLYVSFTSIMAIVLFIANISFCERKAERAGDMVVFSSVKFALVLLSSLIGAILLGDFLAERIIEDTSAFYGLMPGFVVIFIIMQMVVEKTFNIGNKIEQFLPMGIVAAVLFGGMFVVNNWVL